MAKKVAIIAVQHPEHKHLWLHGLRRDTQSFAQPGGHFMDGELPAEAAARELHEETGLRLKPEEFQACRNGCAYTPNGKIEIHMFTAKLPKNAAFNIGDDPDAEFSALHWINPLTNTNMYVPPERNFLIQHLRGIPMEKSEELSKAPLAAFSGQEHEDEWLGENLPRSIYREGDAVKTNKAGSLHGKPLYHHIIGDDDPEADDVQHLLSFSPDPSRTGISHIKVGKHKNVAHAYVSATDPHYQGMGLGTKLYALATKHHGKLVSDTMLSGGSDAIYRKLGEKKGFKLKAGSPTTEQPHTLYFKKKAKKLAKTEQTEDNNSLMNRIEDKYFVRADKLPVLLAFLRPRGKHGDPDTSVHLNVNRTIYLDSNDLNCFFDYVERARPRFKMRIRQYAPQGKEWEKVAYVELKVKTEDDVTKKIRVRIASSDVQSIARGKQIKITEHLRELNRDISAEILWHRVASINAIVEKHGFKKQVEVRYRRRAYGDDKIRVTVDDALRYYGNESFGPDVAAAIDNAEASKKFTKKVTRLRRSQYLVVEVKHEDNIPKWVEEMLRAVRAEKVKFSKYCAAIVTARSAGRKDGRIMTMDLGDSEPAALTKSEDLEKSKNVRQQKQKLFGGWKTSPGSPEREKQMGKMKEHIESRYQAPVTRAPGKPNKMGKIIDKPDLTTGEIQHIGNPDSLIHEAAHLETAPEQMSMADFQRYMDLLWGKQNVQYGFKQQARLTPEFEATAIENMMRRKLGLPAHQKVRDVTREEQMYAADRPGTKVLKDYPAKKIPTYDKKGKPVTGSRHLTGGKEVLSPESKLLMIMRESAKTTYHPERGWETIPTADTFIRLREEGFPEVAARMAKEYFKDRTKPSAVARDLGNKLWYMDEPEKDRNLESMKADLKQKQQVASSPADSLYHILVDGNIVTQEPLTLQQIHQRHGGPQKLEASGARLLPIKYTQAMKTESYFQNLAKNYLLSSRRKAWDKVMAGVPKQDVPAHMVPEKGVHQPGYGKGWTKYGDQLRQHGGISDAGRALRTMHSAKRQGNRQGAMRMRHEAKGYHQRILADLRAMKAPALKSENYFSDLAKSIRYKEAPPSPQDLDIGRHEQRLAARQAAEAERLSAIPKDPAAYKQYLASKRAAIPPQMTPHERRQKNLEAMSPADYLSATSRTPAQNKTAVLQAKKAVGQHFNQARVDRMKKDYFKNRAKNNTL